MENIAAIILYKYFFRGRIFLKFLLQHKKKYLGYFFFIYYRLYAAGQKLGQRWDKFCRNKLLFIHRFCYNIQGRQKILFFYLLDQRRMLIKRRWPQLSVLSIIFLETYQIACVLALHDDNAMLINKHYVMTHRPCQKYFASRGQKASKRCKNMDHHLIDKNIAAGGTAG